MAHEDFSLCPLGISFQTQVSKLEARPRLEARLRRALAGHLTIVTAAVGYGKTIALARAAEFDHRPALGYRCVAGDTSADVACQLVSALAAQQEAHPIRAGDIRRRITPICSFGEDSDCWGALRVALATAPYPHLLLLDDVHQLVDADQLMAFLATELPTGWQAVIASGCEIVQADVSRLFCEGKADRLDEGDLAFDVDEANAAASAWGLERSDAGTACHQALGWPIGVCAILHGRRSELAGYLQGAVLDAAPVRLRRFLKATAVLERLTPEACEAITGHKNAPKLLLEIVFRHLFVQRESDGLSYHPLFRAILLDAVQRENPRLLKRQYQQATNYYLSRGNIECAIRSTYAGGDESRGLELFCDVARRLSQAKQAAELLEWTAKFPADLSMARPWLLHYRGVGLRLTNTEGDEGFYATAQRLQEQALEVFNANNSQEGRARALAELGTLACLQQRPVEAERLFKEARNVLDNSDLVLRVSVLSSLADTYVLLDRLQEAIRTGEDVLALTAGGSTSPMISIQVFALQQLALAHVRDGHLRLALELASRALQICREQTLDPHSQVLSQFVLGYVYSAKGDLEQSVEILISAEALATRYSLKHQVQQINAARAQVLAFMDRLDEAEKLFREAGDLSHYFADVGILRFLQNRFLEARMIFQQQLDDGVGMGMEADVSRARAGLGVIALHLGRLSEAERWLLEAARSFEQSGAFARLAGARLHLAHLYLLKGQRHRCERYLRAAFDFGAQQECYTFMLWHPKTIALLGSYALVEGILPGYVEILCTRLLPARYTLELMPLMSHHDPSVRGPATRIVNAILNRQGGEIGISELDYCHEDAIRSQLTRAFAEGRLTSRGLLVLRHEYRLTWSQIDVFVEHYLCVIDGLAETVEPERAAVAQRLGISENTLKHHLTSIRQKLGLGARKGSAAVLLWALAKGITKLPPRAEVELPSSEMLVSTRQPLGCLVGTQSAPYEASLEVGR